jgi:hypothetical protein
MYPVRWTSEDSGNKFWGFPSNDKYTQLSDLETVVSPGWAVGLCHPSCSGKNWTTNSGKALKLKCYLSPRSSFGMSKYGIENWDKARTAGLEPTRWQWMNLRGRRTNGRLVSDLPEFGESPILAIARIPASSRSLSCFRPVCFLGQPMSITGKLVDLSRT